MAFEIERKFLVLGQDWRSLVRSQTRVRQAYLSSGEKSSTRVRIKDDTAASVAIKSKAVGLRRLEVEYAISLIDAEALLALRQSGLIEKIRYEVPWQGHVWEVDEFSGDNAGLLIAEVELREESETFERPPWLGVEVTGQAQYYNGSLARHPYRAWKVSPLLVAG